MTLLMPADDPDYRPPAWMGLPEGTDVSGQTRPATEHYRLDQDADLGLVLSQDAALLPLVQAGMRSRGFSGQLWGEQEQRLRHFHVELERRLRPDASAYAEDHPMSAGQMSAGQVSSGQAACRR